MGLKPRQTQWTFEGRIRHSWHFDGIVIHRSGYLIFNLWTSKRFGKWPIALVYRSSGIILWLWSKVKQKSCFPSSPDFYKDPPLFNFRQRENERRKKRDSRSWWIDCGYLKYSLVSTRPLFKQKKKSNRLGFDVNFVKLFPQLFLRLK